MARIVYWDKSGQEQSVSIGHQFPEITIGRHPDCVIQTTNGSVSRRHCVIRQAGDGFEIIDQKSSSGTYINNQRINQQPLRDGDEIYCGSFTLRFYAEEAGAAPDQESVVTLRGMLLFTDDDNIQRQIWIDDQNPQVLVGRSTECQIRTSDGSVSRRHSEFSCGGGVFQVQDMGSSNGTYVNGNRVNHQLLRHQDEINCGRLTIRFTIEESYSRAAPSAAPVTAQSPQVSPASSAAHRPAPLHAGIGSMPPPRPSNIGAAPLSGAHTGLGMSAPVRPVDQFSYDALSGANNAAAPPAVNHSPSPDNARPSAQPDAAPASPKALSFAADALPQPEPDQTASLEAALTKARADLDALALQLEEVNAESDERARELDKALQQKQVVIDSFQERYDRLKVQSDEQINQLESYRDELRQKREVIEDLQYKLNLIEEAQNRGNTQVAQLIEENAELKVQINQLERSLTESDRLSNLNEFELKRVRDELENLREMVSSEGSENNHLQNEIARLRQVLDAKEAALDNAERSLETLQLDSNAYRADADRSAGEMERLRGDVADKQQRLDALLRENQQLRDAQHPSDNPIGQAGALDDLRADNEHLKAELEHAQQQLHKLSQAGNAGNQINALRRENRDQRHRIEELEAHLENLEQTRTTQTSAYDPDAERRLTQERDTLLARVEELEAQLNQEPRQTPDPHLERDLQLARDENHRLRQELEARRHTPEASSPDIAALKAEASSAYELLNDVVSQLKNDMQLIQDYITDIRTVYDHYKRLDLEQLPTLDRVRIEKVLREMDPEITFEELDYNVGECVRSSEDMKSRLLSFKDKVLD